MRAGNVKEKSFSHRGHREHRGKPLGSTANWFEGINPHLFGVSLRAISVMTTHAIHWFMLQAEMRWMQGRSKACFERNHTGSVKARGLSIAWLCRAALVFFARNRFFRVCHFLPLLMLLLLPLTPALAGNQPDMRDFARVMPLTLSAGGALYELPLPAEVYLWSKRRDLGDLAVFNGRGEMVPFTLLEPKVTRTSVPARQLPLFPLSAPARSLQGDLSLQVRTNEQGAIVNLNTTQGVRPGRPSASYIVDASALDQPVAGFDLALAPGSKGYVGTVRVESSDDLQQWQTRASGAVATLVAGERQLGRDRIEFSAVKARYFRLSVSPGEGVPRIESVAVRLEPPLATQQREKQNITITPVRDRDGEYLARTLGPFPVDRVRLIFRADNSLASVAILSRPDDKSPWTERGSGTFYRLRRDASQVESTPLEIKPTSDQQWLIRVRQPGGNLGSVLPCLEVGWRPHRLLFTAHGEPPFRLAYGSARIGADSLRDESLALSLKTWEQQRIKPFPALAGASQESGGRQALRPRIPAATWRDLSLWGALLLGVSLLSGMAWRLVKEMGLGGTQKKKL